VVEGNGLENRRGASHRRFESCPLRQILKHHDNLLGNQEVSLPKSSIITRVTIHL
jgi:hypothetical protein